jgi:PPK2 family polyphosphate:nucleotide phosphotransferase
MIELWGLRGGRCGRGNEGKHTMVIESDEFRVREGEAVRLKNRPTRIKSFYTSKAESQDMLQAHVEHMSDLQRLLYASNRYALLVIFQAMDAAGKDGAIRHVMSGINPQGCQVHSFKHPSAEELDHDFLWRTTVRLPERGQIGIFNRSYYEEVLIVRVHPELLAAEAVPNGKQKPNAKVWQQRYRSIRMMEEHLHRNGTRIVKIFLHISREEQRQRLLARVDDPQKNWKVSAADIEERKYWKDYMRAYEDCMLATSTDKSPWYIVPADDKPNARLIVSQILLDQLGALKLKYPKATGGHRKELLAIRKLLAKKS